MKEQNLEKFQYTRLKPTKDLKCTYCKTSCQCARLLKV